MILSIFCLLNVVFAGAYAQIGSPNIPSVFPGFPGFAPNTNPVSSFITTFMPWLATNAQQQPPRTIAGLPSGSQIVSSLLGPWLNPNNLQAFPNLPPFSGFLRPGQGFPGLNGLNRPEATEPETPAPITTPNANPIQTPNSENIDLQQVVPGVPNLPGSELITNQ